jgi:hypothetical protein
MKLVGMVMAVALASACGCKNGDKSTSGNGNGNGNGNPPTGHTAAECDALSDAIAKLYSNAAPAPPDETPEAGKLREQEARDNLAMVMADCKKDPNRVVPCAKAATSVDTLERSCLLPLDDEGNVEQQQFSK